MPIYGSKKESPTGKAIEQQNMTSNITEEELKQIIYKEGRKLLDYYDNLIAFYNVANELYIYMDTYADAAMVNMSLELRYALDHVIEALDYIRKNNSLLDSIIWMRTHTEDNLSEYTFPPQALSEIFCCQNKLKSANGHIIRCAYDSFEILCLERLDEIETTINRTSQTILHRIGLNIVEVYQRIYKIKKEIAEFKIKKDQDVTVDDLKKLLDKAKEYLSFYDENMVKLYSIAQEQAKEKRFSRKTFWLSMIINTVVTLGVTIGVTFLVEWILGLFK